MSYSDTIFSRVLMYANSLLIEVNCRRSPAAFLGQRFRNVLVLVPISVRRRARIYIRNRWLAGHFTGLKVGMRAVLACQMKSIFRRPRCECMGCSFVLLAYQLHAFPFGEMRCIGRLIIVASAVVNCFFGSWQSLHRQIESDFFAAEPFCSDSRESVHGLFEMVVPEVELQ